jgi:hypothetical protein
MTYFTPILLASALVLAFSPRALAQGSMAGDWEITFNTPQGASTVNLTLKQEGEKLTGDLSSPIGAVPVTGSAIEGAVVLAASISLQGNALELGLNGKMEGELLNGTARFGDFGEFPFTAKRAVKSAASVPAAGAAATEAAPVPAIAATDANGKWAIKLLIEGVGEFPVSATLAQEGEKVSGTLTSEIGETPVTGTMTGASLKLEFTATTPQGPIPITMTGELVEGAFSGKASLAGMGEAPWTAVRVQ